MFNRNLLLAAAAIAAPVFAGTAIAAPPVQMAQAPKPQAPQQPRQAPKPLTKADFTKTVDLSFGNMDKNKDGSLSKEEIAAAQTAALQRAAAVQQQRIEAQFRQLDTNKDNQLSLAEFRAMAPSVRAQQTPDQMLAQLDANKDGRISAQEYRAPQLTNFDKADANNDGIVTPQEAQAARRR